MSHTNHLNINNDCGNSMVLDQWRVSNLKHKTISRKCERTRVYVCVWLCVSSSLHAATHVTFTSFRFICRQFHWFFIEKITHQNIYSNAVISVVYTSLGVGHFHLRRCCEYDWKWCDFDRIIKPIELNCFARLKENHNRFSYTMLNPFGMSRLQENGLDEQ